MKNEFKVYGDWSAIVIRRKDGLVLEALIDTVDLGRVDEMPNAWCVYFDKTTESFYVTGGNTYGGLHRWIMQPQSKYHIDHINHNTLDNRRSNLRTVTPEENRQNLKLHKRDNTMRNISYHKSTGLWRVQLHINGRNRHFGAFPTIEEAQQVAQNARMEHMPFAVDARAIV